MAPPELQPAVSVVIAAHDAEATLGETLEALAGQRLDLPYEVIVVDDGSADSTPDLARRHGVRLVSTEWGGPGPARNAGVEASGAPVIAFTDADCRPDPDWLREGLDAITDRDLVQGRVRRDSRVAVKPFDRSIGVTGETGLYECANLFIRRSAFDGIGGFQELVRARVGKPLGEDVWLGWRVRRAGGRTHYSNRPLVEHAVFRRGARDFVAERLRLFHFPAMVGRVPELRRSFLFAAVFLNRRSASFDLALAGVMATALGTPPAMLVAVIPYSGYLLRTTWRWRRHALRVLPAEVTADLVSLVSLLAGSIRFRSLVI